MKKLKYLLSMFVVFAFLSACSNNETKENNKSTDEVAEEVKNEIPTDIVKVEKASLVYFHYTKRCATCNAIKSVSEEVEEAYTGEVDYTEYNLDETEGEEMGEKLSADGQTYFLLYGENKFDLTEEAFLNAKSNPGKFKEIIKKRLDAVLM